MNTVAQVELDSLLRAGAGAIVAGLAVTLAFALALRGLITAAEHQREGRPGLSALAGALGAIALLAALGGVVGGLVVVAGR